MPFRYVPHLRSKLGEAVALDNLSAAAKSRTLPIIHLGPSVSSSFVRRLGTAWAGLRLGVDGHFNYGETNSTQDLTDVIAQLRGAGVLALPSLEVDCSPTYAAAAVPLAAQFGAIVKVRLGQLGHLLNWLAGVGLAPGQVDLVLCAGHLPTLGAGVIDPVVTNALQGLPGAGAWRSVTLASSAAPKDHTALPLGPSAVPRLDWQLWQAVHGTAGFPVDYGDHGIGHPDMTEPPPYAMGRATVSARYTRDNDWLVIKGRPTSGNNGIAMPVQYRAHAAVFAADPGFGGLPSCWGDTRIGQIAANVGSSGSRQTWVEMSLNRHIELVADRLP